MASLDILDLDSLDLAPRPATGRHDCAGCGQPRLAALALVVTIAGRAVCLPCVREHWGDDAAQLVEQLTARYLDARRAEALAALARAGDRLLGQAQP